MSGFFVRPKRALCLLSAVVWLFAGSGGTGRAEEAVQVEDSLESYEPALLLSWHAPYGDPRATDHLEVSCSDTSRADTLYLNFRSRALPRVSSMSATLYFHPLGGDTLGEFWFFKTGWPNGGNVTIETFDFPCEFPWRRRGTGAVDYDHRSGRGRLDITYSVPESHAGPIQEGRMYCLARIVIRQRRSYLAGCTQPVCVEWAGGWIRYYGGREYEIPSGNESFVSWNASGGPACAEHVPHKSMFKPWRLKPPQERPQRR